MCLVLGCPGSGCSTFLKAVANERASYAAVRGDIRYAGIDHVEMKKHYKGEVVYNQEGKRAAPRFPNRLLTGFSHQMIITSPHLPLPKPSISP